MALCFQTTESDRNDILSALSEKWYRLLCDGVFPIDVRDTTREQAILFHHIVAVVTLMRVNGQSAVRDRESAMRGFQCQFRMIDYAKQHISEEVSEKVSANVAPAMYGFGGILRKIVDG